MRYHFYLKNSEPVYGTEYMQSLKQFAVQEVFPAYVPKVCFDKETNAMNHVQIMSCNGSLSLAFLHTAK